MCYRYSINTFRWINEDIVLFHSSGPGLEALPGSTVSGGGGCDHPDCVHNSGVYSRIRRNGHS